MTVESDASPILERVQPASLWNRFCAGSSTVVLFVFGYGVLTIVGNILFWRGDDRSPLIVLTYILQLAWIAAILSYGAAFSASLGMTLAALRFVDAEGKNLTFSFCFFRLILGIVMFPLLPITMALCFLDPRRRGIADRLCGTMVVPRVKAPKAPRGFEVLPRANY